MLLLILLWIVGVVGLRTVMNVDIIILLIRVLNYFIRHHFRAWRLLVWSHRWVIILLRLSLYLTILIIARIRAKFVIYWNSIMSSRCCRSTLIKRVTSIVILACIRSHVRQRVYWINATRNGADTSSCFKWWQSFTRGILETSSKVLLIILVLNITLRHHIQWRARIRSCAPIFFRRLVLKIKWIVCLVIQESLTLKEIFPPLESRLLLHLLERIPSTTIITHLLLLLLVSSSGAVIGILIFQTDSTICVQILLISVTMNCARWTSVSKWHTFWYSINVSSHERYSIILIWRLLILFGQVTLQITILAQRSHISLMTNWRWWVSVYRMTFRWPIFRMN